MRPTVSRNRKMWTLLGALLSLTLALGTIGPEGARAAETPEGHRGSTRWGSGFERGTMSTGFAVGAGVGAKIFGTEVNHDLALAYGSVGRILTDMIAPGKWYSGNLELRGEIFAGAQYSPQTRYVTGFSLIPRYNFVTGSRWVPFVDAGAGLSLTDIGEPDLSSTFEFNIQLGFGSHYFFRDDAAFTFQFRGLHLSNAGLDMPNNGVNSFLLLGGVSWFF